MLSRLRADIHRLRRHRRAKFGYSSWLWFLDPAWTCVLLHRVSHWLLLMNWPRASRFFLQANSLLTGADIHPRADLGPGLLIPSPCGVNISGRAGANLTMGPLAGIGGSVRDADVGAGVGLPVIGDNVTLEWFAAVQGSVTIGDGVIVDPGVGAVVDVVDGARMSAFRSPMVGDRAAETRSPRAAAANCEHKFWARGWSDYHADVDRFRGELRAYAPNGAKSPPFIGAALTNSLLALAVYRFSHWLHLNGHRGSALWLSQLNFLLHKVTLPPGLCLGPGALMPHLGGCVLHGRAGQGLTFYAGSLVVSDDSAFSTPPEAAPWLGDDVLMAGNAGAFGPIVVGDGAQFGPKARSARDLASGRRIWDRLSRGSARPRQARGTPVRETRPRRLVLPDGGAWRETRRRMRRDRERLGATPRYPALTCSWLYRVSHAFHATGRPRFARWTWWLNVTLTGADISPCCEIGAGLLIPHPAGLALHGRAGEDLTLGALTAVTASLDEQDRLAPLDAAPWLGDNVRLEHHACVFGPIDVGDGAMILHGCVVAEPVPANATVAPMNPILQRVDSGHRHSAARNRERPLIGDPQLSDM